MADAPETPKRDYRSTVFLPRTDFPMKAGLPQKEPVIAAKWAEADLYGQIRKDRAGKEKFIFHDGLRGKSLVAPMITGKAATDPRAQPMRRGKWWMALICLAVALGISRWVVAGAPPFRP